MPRTSSKRGRQPDPSSKSGKIRELLKTGMSAGDIAKKVGCTPALVYNVKGRISGGGKRGPGRPRKASLSSMSGLAGILDAVKNTEREKAQLRSVLERIQAAVAAALTS